jgi:hypothetical protein
MTFFVRVILHKVSIFIINFKNCKLIKNVEINFEMNDKNVNLKI